MRERVSSLSHFDTSVKMFEMRVCNATALVWLCLYAVIIPLSYADCILPPSARLLVNANARASKKFVVVTGGVVSGIGKGVTASSIGSILKMMDIQPTAIKIDPYLNVDAGTMSPYEHGEVFVLDDGAETDLDLGNYERFLDVRLTNDSNLTTGKVYQAVIAKERRGDYLGKTVQIIPHITNEIMERMLCVARRPVSDTLAEPDVCVIELGGTIGEKSCILSLHHLFSVSDCQHPVPPSFPHTQATLRAWPLWKQSDNYRSRSERTIFAWCMYRWYPPLEKETSPRRNPLSTASKVSCPLVRPLHFSVN